MKAVMRRMTERYRRAKKTGRVDVTVTALAEAINVFQQVVKGVIVLHLRSLKKTTSSVNPALHI